MSDTNFTFDMDGDVAVVTWDMPGRSMNVITLEVMDELDALVDRVTDDESVKGAVIVSGKEGSFTGGADITMLAAMFGEYDKAKARDEAAATRLLFEQSGRLSGIYRKMETCGKPFVVGLDGTCMGGGTELALAAHGRLATDGLKMGLPEVKIGIFPGAGGTQRVMRMVDAQQGLQFLLQGRTLRAPQAKGMGLVDEVVPRDQLASRGVEMIRGGLDPVKPWDKDKFRLQGASNIYSPAGFQLWPAANALYRKETHDNYPGARAIMSAVYEGLQLPMDQALRVENRYFAHVLQTVEARSMIRSLFVSMQALNKGARRPASVGETNVRRVGVVGAGFMGAGIAYVSAKAGLEVVLLDVSHEAAEKGKSHSDTLMSKDVQKGRATEEAKQELLSRIHAGDDFAALADCDLVIEAVFEDRKVKAELYDKVRGLVRQGVVFASNTSTLPITSLATSYGDAERFIGIHFFSPVDKMMLVEIIMGAETGDEALATALDFVRAIKKTPIVVNDTRGFYANRCVLNYIREGHLMLTEGVPPAMIENVAKQAGMPVGPLALNDEVALDLAWKILQATKADLGDDAIDPAQETLLKEMVVDRERFGRKNGKGFYDYEGREKSLWPGLADVATQKPADAFDRKEIEHRLLVTQALEAARCMEEGVVTDPREADVGSILGWGFAPYTGGTLSYIDGMGAAAFVERARELEARHGERFSPPALLVEMAKNGETFYGRFGAEEERQAA